MARGQKDLTQGKEWKVIARFALPMLLGSILQQLYGLADSIIIGRYLGKDSLAAVGTTWPIIYIMIAFAIGIGSGNSTLIAQYFGAKRSDQAQLAISTQFIFLLFIGVLSTVIGLILSEELILLLNVPSLIAQDAKAYFEVILYGMLFTFGYNSISSILRGLGDSTTPLYFILIATILNVVLDIYFIAYLKLGVESAAWATNISQAISLILALGYLGWTHPIISLKLKDLVFSKKMFIKSIQIGLPTGVQQIAVASGILAIWSIVNTYGPDASAAYTAVGRIDAIAIMPSLLIAGALSSFAGQNIGAKRYDRVLSGFKSTIAISLVVSGVISLAIIFFSGPLLHLFIPPEPSNAKAIEIAQSYLFIVCPFYFLFALMFASHGLFRGAGDTLIPLYISILSLWIIQIPFAYWLSGIYGVSGIWGAVPAAWFISCLASYAYYFSGRWRKKKIIS